MEIQGSKVVSHTYVILDRHPSEGNVRFYTGRGAWFSSEYTDAHVFHAYEEAYDGGAAKLREEAREFALAYDARKVFRECWAPILSELVPGA